MKLQVKTDYGATITIDTSDCKDAEQYGEALVEAILQDFDKIDKNFPVIDVFKYLHERYLRATEHEREYQEAQNTPNGVPYAKSYNKN